MTFSARFLLSNPSFSRLPLIAPFESYRGHKFFIVYIRAYGLRLTTVPGATCCYVLFITSENNINLSPGKGINKIRRKTSLQDFHGFVQNAFPCLYLTLSTMVLCIISVNKFTTLSSFLKELFNNRKFFYQIKKFYF